MSDRARHLPVTSALRPLPPPKNTVAPHKGLAILEKLDFCINFHNFYTKMFGFSETSLLWCSDLKIHPSVVRFRDQWWWGLLHWILFLVGVIHSRGTPAGQNPVLHCCSCVEFIPKDLIKLSWRMPVFYGRVYWSLLPELLKQTAIYSSPLKGWEVLIP